jgi:hypothetical protein
MQLCAALLARYDSDSPMAGRLRRGPCADISLGRPGISIATAARSERHWGRLSVLRATRRLPQWQSPSRMRGLLGGSVTVEGPCYACPAGEGRFNRNVFKNATLCSGRPRAPAATRRHLQCRTSTAQLNVYPTPRSVTTSWGCDGSASILRRNRATWTSMERS